MSATASASESGSRPGRRPKGGIKRKVVQAYVPEPLHEALVRLADEASVPASDLGAYYLITGWNRVREAEGLAPIPMPAYLLNEVELRRPVEIQDPLEESLLAS